MKRIPAIISLVTCLFLPSVLPAQDQDEDETASRAVIFNFSTMGNSTDSGYYSYIIPDALARQLVEKQDIETDRSQKELHPGLSADKTGSEILKAAAQDEKNDTVITGTVILSNIAAQPSPDRNRIKVKPGKNRKQADPRIDQKQMMTLIVVVYDAELDKKLVVTTEPFVAGALLQDAIDAISKNTAERLALFENEKNALAEKIQEQPEPAPAVSEQGPSPYLSFISGISEITLGMDAGTLMFLGSAGDEFENTQMIYPWMSFPLGGLVPGLGFSLGMNYFAADNKGNNSTIFYIMECWSAVAGATYARQVTNWFAPEVRISGGLARSITTIYATASNDMPFSAYKNSKNSDPCMDISAGFRFSLSPVHLRTGVLYKRIFSDDGINALSLFAGLALSF